MNAEYQAYLDIRQAELDQKHAEALAYIAKLRNPSKRDYARRFYMYLLGGKEPTDTTGLSIMARQAVRMNLEAILER